MTALKQPGIKLRVKKIYGETFSRLRESLQKAQELMDTTQSLLDTSFRQINTGYGFSLQVPKVPEMSQCLQDLELIERSHLQYFGLGNVFSLVQTEFVERLVRALSSRVRMVFETALAEVQLWNKSVSAQLDTQLRERRPILSADLERLSEASRRRRGLMHGLAK